MKQQINMSITNSKIRQIFYHNIVTYFNTLTIRYNQALVLIILNTIQLAVVSLVNYQDNKFEQILYKFCFLDLLKQLNNHMIIPMLFNWSIFLISIFLIISFQYYKYNEKIKKNKIIDQDKLTKAIKNNIIFKFLRILFNYNNILFSNIFSIYFFWLYNFKEVKIIIASSISILLQLIFIALIQYHSISYTLTPNNYLIRNNYIVSLIDQYLIILNICLIFVVPNNLGAKIVIGITILRIILKFIISNCKQEIQKIRLICLFCLLSFQACTVMNGILWIQLIIILPVIIILGRFIKIDILKQIKIQKLLNRQQIPTYQQQLIKKSKQILQNKKMYCKLFRMLHLQKNNVKNNKYKLILYGIKLQCITLFEQKWCQSTFIDLKQLFDEQNYQCLVTNYNQILNQQIQLIIKIINFIRFLQMNKPKCQILIEQSKDISNLIKSITTNLDILYKLNPCSKLTLFFFLIMYKIIISNQDQSQRIVKKRIQQMQQNNYSNKKFQKKIFSPNTSAVFLSMSQEIGKIIAVSKKFKVFYGYEFEQLIGKNINQLMPNSISQIHNQFLINFIDSGRISQYLNKQIIINFYIYHKNYYLLKVSIQVTIRIVNSQQLQLGGFLQAKDDGEPFLLCDKNGYIEGYSEKMQELFKFGQFIKKQKRNFNILPMIPALHYSFFEIQSGSTIQQIITWMVIPKKLKKNYLRLIHEDDIKLMTRNILISFLKILKQEGSKFFLIHLIFERLDIAGGKLKMYKIIQMKHIQCNLYDISIFRNILEQKEQYLHFHSQIYKIKLKEQVNIKQKQTINSSINQNIIYALNVFQNHQLDIKQQSKLIEELLNQRNVQFKQKQESFSLLSTYLQNLHPTQLQIKQYSQQSFNWKNIIPISTPYFIIYFYICFNILLIQSIISHNNNINKMKTFYNDSLILNFYKIYFLNTIINTSKIPYKDENFTKLQYIMQEQMEQYIEIFVKIKQNKIDQQDLFIEKRNMSMFYLFNSYIRSSMFRCLKKNDNKELMINFAQLANYLFARQLKTNQKQQRLYTNNFINIIIQICFYILQIILSIIYLTFLYRKWINQKQFIIVFFRFEKNELQNKNMQMIKAINKLKQKCFNSLLFQNEFKNYIKNTQTKIIYFQQNQVMIQKQIKIQFNHSDQYENKLKNKKHCILIIFISLFLLLQIAYSFSSTFLKLNSFNQIKNNYMMFKNIHSLFYIGPLLQAQGNIIKFYLQLNYKKKIQDFFSNQKSILQLNDSFLLQNQLDKQLNQYYLLLQKQKQKVQNLLQQNMRNYRYLYQIAQNLQKPICNQLQCQIYFFGTISNSFRSLINYMLIKFPYEFESMKIKIFNNSIQVDYNFLKDTFQVMNIITLKYIQLMNKTYEIFQQLIKKNLIKLILLVIIQFFALLILIIGSIYPYIKMKKQAQSLEMMLLIFNTETLSKNKYLFNIIKNNL